MSTKNSAFFSMRRLTDVTPRIKSTVDSEQQRCASGYPEALQTGPDDAIDFATIRRVLVVKLKHVGDVLLATPIPQILKQRYPHLTIDALVYENTTQILSGHPALSQIYSVPRRSAAVRGVQRGLLEWKLWWKLRASAYDLIIHLNHSSRSNFLARSLGATYNVAPNSTGKRWARAFTHLFPVARGNSRHTVEFHLDALRRLGLQPQRAERSLVLRPPKTAENIITARLNEENLLKHGFIHVHPLSRWRFKCWPYENFSSLIDRFSAQGWPVVLTAAPDPAEQQYVDALISRLKHPVVDLSGQLTLLELAALTAKARFFVGIDSAPMHIAAAMRTPVVALFGPSGEIEWGPWQTEQRVLYSSHRCRPCGFDGCGGGKQSECLQALSVQQVFETCAEFWQQYG